MNKTAVNKAPIEDFSRLSRKRLEAMAEAAEMVVDCHRVLAKTGDNIVGELLRDTGPFYEWNHYPDGDIYDNTSHSQYYYHAHAEGERPGEHGHFHAFLRPKGMPEGIEPAPVPDYAAPEDPADELSHLVAISMDEKGFPRVLFTVNRWVSAEVWYAADDVIRMLDCFEMDLAHPSWPVNRWITGMVRLFRPQLAALLTRRDRSIADWLEAHPDSNPYKDHGLELTSVIDIDIDAQMAKIAAARGA